MYFPVALVFLALPFLAQASSSETTLKTGLSIPISKRSTLRNADGVVDITKLRARRHRTIEKIKRGFDAFESNTGAAHPLASTMGHSKFSKNGHRRKLQHSYQPRTAGSVPAVDDNDDVWYGAITVGTPGQTFTVQFDTGSSEMFIPGVSCGATCRGHTLYDPSASSTAQYVGKPVKIEYGGDDWASTEQYTDTVTLAGYTATGQVLGSATSTSKGLGIKDFTADGILGMAYQSISSLEGSPVFQSLVAQGQVPEHIFAFYFAQSESELFVGGVNSDHYTGSFTYVPVEKQGFWQISFDSLTVNGKSFLGTTTAIIDTGTSDVTGDTDTVRAFYENIPGSAEVGDGTWTFPCDTNVTVSITFGGTEFTMSPDSFNGGPSDSNTNCVGGISADDSLGKFWVIGDSFLRNVYTVFDLGNNRVGFASLPSVG